MGAPGEGVVEGHLLARAHAVSAEGGDGGGHRGGHRPEVHGDVLGLDQQLALGVNRAAEQSARSLMLGL